MSLHVYKKSAEQDAAPPLRCRIGWHRRWVYGFSAGIGDGMIRCRVDECVRCGR